MTNKSVDAFHLLDQLQLLLDRDPLIDELGFIHPIQLMMLKEAEDAAVLISREYEGDARLSSVPSKNVASSCTISEIEDAVMKHSKALLLLSSDFGTAWNARKLIISKREVFSISDELLVSSLVLSFAPKSETVWNYRKM